MIPPNETILFVGNFLSSSGYTRQVCETLSDLFKSNGWKTYTTSNKLSKIRRLLDIVLTILLKRGQYQIAIIDTFSGSGFWFAYLAAIACKFTGKPYILLLHGGNLPGFLDGCATNFTESYKYLLSPHYLYQRGQVINYRTFFENASALVSPSPYLAQALIDRGFGVIQIPNSINLNVYNFKLRSRIKPRLFWLRSFCDIYNPLMALQVLQLLKCDYPDAILTMAGPDKGALSECKKFVTDAGLSDSVNFPGLLNKFEINQLAQQHDIFINTTNVDNTPVSLIEALALGLPVVTTNVGGIPFLVQDGKTAILVPPDQPTVMAESISKLLDDNKLCAELSKNGRAMAENFSEDQIYQQWTMLLSSRLKNR